MSFLSWLRNRTAIGFPGRARLRIRPTAPRFRPQLEALEGRCLPSTLAVTTYADGGPGSLRAEIAAANSGDTIVFDPSLAGTTIQLTSGELVINKNLTIQGPEWISGNATGANLGGPGGTSRVFEVDGAASTVTLSGLTIIDGEGVAADGSSQAGDGQGGAILNYGLLSLSGCTVSNSLAASLGGGIYNAGTLTVASCTVSGNWAGFPGTNGNGGGIYNTGTLIVSGSTVSDNVAYGPNLYGGFNGISGNGGGIYNAGAMSVSSSTVSYNLAGFAGAGIFNAYGATGMLTGSSVSYNGYTEVSFNTYGNDWEVGGGIYNDGTMTLSGSSVLGNYASYLGSGIYNDATMTLSGCTVSGIYNDGILYNNPGESLSFGSIKKSKKNLYSETVTLTNNTGGPLTGPLSLELTNLRSGVVLTDASGTTNGNPYIRLLNSGNTLKNGASVSVTLTFTAPILGDITFGTEVVAL